MVTQAELRARRSIADIPRAAPVQVQPSAEELAEYERQKQEYEVQKQEYERQQQNIVSKSEIENEIAKREQQFKQLVKSWEEGGSRLGTEQERYLIERNRLTEELSALNEVKDYLKEGYAINKKDVENYVIAKGVAGADLQQRQIIQAQRPTIKTITTITAEPPSTVKAPSKVSGGGGTFIDPKTGLGYSSQYDLTKQGYIRVENIFESAKLSQKEQIKKIFEAPRFELKKEPPTTLQKISKGFLDVSKSTPLALFSPEKSIERVKTAGKIAGVISTPITATSSVGFKSTLESAGEKPSQFITKAPQLYAERKEIEKNIGQYEKDIEKINELTLKQEELNRQIESEEITYKTYEKQFTEAQKEIDRLQSKEFYKKVQKKGGITTFPSLVMEKAGKIGQEEKGRLAIGLLKAGQYASYTTPLRYAYGLEMISSGAQKTEFVPAAKEVGLGLLLLTPTGKSGESGVTTRLFQKIPTTVKLGFGVSAIGGISFLEGMSVYKQTGDIGAGIYAGAGTAIGLGAGVVALGLTKKVSIGEKTYKQKLIEMKQRLPKVQEQLAVEQAQISRLQAKRFKLTKGEVGYRADKFGRLTGETLPPTAEISSLEFSAGTKLNAKQKTALAKYYKDVGAAKTYEEALKMVEEARVGTIAIKTELPKEMTISGGELKDIFATKKLPELKYSPFIGRQEAKFGVLGTGVTTPEGAKQLIYIGDITKTGKLSMKGELQIITGTKGQKYAEITPFKPAKRFREVKVEGQPPLEVSEVGFKKGAPTIVRIEKSAIKKIEGTPITLRKTTAEFSEVSPFGRREFVQPTEFVEELTKKVSVSESKELFKKGRITSKDIIKEEIITGKKTPFETKAQIELTAGEKGIISKGEISGTAQKFVSLSEIKTKGISPVTFEIPKISETKIIRTPLSKTFAGELPKTISVQKAEPPITVFTLPKKITFRPEYPSIVEFRGTAQSIYQPSGMSILGGVALKEVTEPTTMKFSVSGVSGKELSIQAPSMVYIEKPEIKEETKFKPAIKEKAVSIQRPVEKLKMVEPTKEELVEPLKIKQMPRLETKQMQRQITKLLTKEITRRPTPQKPSIKEPKIIPPAILKKTPQTKVSAKKLLEGMYEAFTFKGGKEVRIGEFKTQQKAEAELAKTLKSTLRAGGFITKEGKPLKAEELGILGGEFRISKISPFRIIEVAPKRLRKGTTGKQIQFFRQMKGGKNIKFL